MLMIPSSFTEVVNVWQRQSGFPEIASPFSSCHAKASIPIELWGDYLRDCVAGVPGTTQGFDIGTEVQITHVGPLAYLLVNSSTFHELLNHYLLFEKWFYGQSWANLQSSDDEIIVSWRQTPEPIDRLLEQLHSLVFVNSMVSVCPGVGSPLSVHVTNQELGDAEFYERAYGCPVLFGASELRVVFSKKVLNASVNIGKGSLSHFWDKSQRLLNHVNTGVAVFAQSVQTEILLQLPYGAHIDAVAQRLNLSRRSLQRRLAVSGCTYRLLVDGIREKRARDLIEESNLKLNEVSFLLGYSEQSAFNHAYKRWTGCSPLATDKR